MIVSEEEQSHIQEFFGHYYVMNASNDAFLARKGYQIPLQEFHCYCYGNRVGGERTLRLFQFVEMGEQGFHVYLQGEEKSIWVPDLVSLRRDIFQFKDQTSLFRSSFLYDPVEKMIFRLHLLHYFLYLPSVEKSCLVGLVSVEKKKQILKKLQKQCTKIERSIL